MIGDCRNVFNEVGGLWLASSHPLPILSSSLFSQNYLWAEPSKVLLSRQPLDIMQLKWLQTMVRNNFHKWAVGSCGRMWTWGLLGTSEACELGQVFVPQFPNLSNGHINTWFQDAMINIKTTLMFPVLDSSLDRLLPASGPLTSRSSRPLKNRDGWWSPNPFSLPLFFFIWRKHSPLFFIIIWTCTFISHDRRHSISGTSNCITNQDLGYFHITLWLLHITQNID